MEPRVRVAHRSAFEQIARQLLLLFSPVLLLIGSFAVMRISASRGKDNSRFQIQTSSMSPALRGYSVESRCGTCGSSQFLASEDIGLAGTHRCAKCGGKKTATFRCEKCGKTALMDSDTLSRVSPDFRIRCACGEQLSPRVEQGDVVKLSKLDTDNLKRFELVAFDASSTVQQKGASKMVKRVWGLPGESVSIRDGELWIDGRMLQKTLIELKQIAIPVSHLRAPLGIGWEGFESARPNEDGYVQVFSQPGMQQTWFATNLLKGDLDALPVMKRFAPGPLRDEYDSNALRSLYLANVRDILIEIQLVQDLSSQLTLSGSYLGRTYQIFICPVGAHPPKTNASNAEFVFADRDISIALCDERILIETDCDQKQLEFSPASDWTWNEFDLKTTSPPTKFQLSCDKRIEFRDIRVHRDIHLRTDFPRSRNSIGDEVVELSKNQVFVLGDNQPVSIDSRNELGVLALSDLIGSVQKVEEQPAK